MINDTSYIFARIVTQNSARENGNTAHPAIAYHFVVLNNNRAFLVFVHIDHQNFIFSPALRLAEIFQEVPRYLEG